jgi:hypothetical protein
MERLPSPSSFHLRRPGECTKTNCPRIPIQPSPPIHIIGEEEMVGYLFVTLEQTRPEEDPRTQCVQRLDESLGCAVHVNYRILPRSSSFREPRYPLLEVMVVFFLSKIERDGKRKRIFKMIKPPQKQLDKKNDLFFNEVSQFSHHRANDDDVGLPPLQSRCRDWHPHVARIY